MMELVPWIGGILKLEKNGLILRKKKLLHTQEATDEIKLPNTVIVNKISYIIRSNLVEIVPAFEVDGRILRKEICIVYHTFDH